MYIEKPLIITKGNNSHGNGPLPLFFIISICPVYMNVYARFDEISSMTLKVFRKQNVIAGRMDGRTDNVKTVYPSTNTVCGGRISVFSKTGKLHLYGTNTTLVEFLIDIKLAVL